MYIVIMASGCTHDKAWFVSLDDLDEISTLLDEDNDLEEEITYLFNEVSIFTNLLPTTIQVLNIHRTCTVIPDNFEQF